MFLPHFHFDLTIFVVRAVVEGDDFAATADSLIRDETEARVAGSIGTVEVVAFPFVGRVAFCFTKFVKSEAELRRTGILLKRMKQKHRTR
jgi:hypothetical protein